MKKNKKITISFLTLLLALLSFTPKVIGSTTIGTSTFPANNGDFYRWDMTECNPDYAAFAGVGSYYNITIQNIYQGPTGIHNALIVNVHAGRYRVGLDSHMTGDVPGFILYNKSLNYFRFVELFIIPIPLNLTMVLEAIESKGYTGLINGNEITLTTSPGDYSVYTFNSNGFATKIVSYENNDFLYTHTLHTVPPNGIAFGNYYIIFSTIAIGIVAIVVKKRINFKRQI